MTKAQSNTRCVICGEVRSVESAHIMPQKNGGKESIPLCPNHHKAYDKGLLYPVEILALPTRACNYYTEKYGKGFLTAVELGRLEALLDKQGFTGEYRQGYGDAMRDFLRMAKSPEFASMLKDAIQSQG